MRQRAKFLEDRPNHSCDFKMASVRHVGLFKIQNFYRS